MLLNNQDSRTAARAVPTIAFQFVADDAHIVQNALFFIRPWRIGSSGTPNPTDFPWAVHIFRNAEDGVPYLTDYLVWIIQPFRKNSK